jgi:hypothetical protein
MGWKWTAPDFLNLGVAFQHPRGAMVFAPCVAAVPFMGLGGDPFRKIRHAHSPKILSTYVLPLSQLVAGSAYSARLTNALSPNPYQGAGNG